MWLPARSPSLPRSILAVSLLVAACGLSLGTSRVRPLRWPIYMSWSAFRRSAAVLPPRPLETPGSIYLWGDLLLVTEPGQGIAVFDNHSPERPMPLCFLRVLGNADLATHGRYLYADSFTDLVIFERTADPVSFRVTGRVADTFPYDVARMIPEGQTFDTAPVDMSQGVVVGWTKVRPRGAKDEASFRRTKLGEGSRARPLLGEPNEGTRRTPTGLTSRRRFGRRQAGCGVVPPSNMARYSPSSLLAADPPALRPARSGHTGRRSRQGSSGTTDDKLLNFQDLEDDR